MTEIWAHRGARLVAPENTLAAFAAAAEVGADGVELDVHLTADGRLTVRHDPLLTLPDGSVVPLAQLTRAEVAQADVGDAGSGVHRVPHLSEVLELLSPTSMRVNVEIKVGTKAPYRGIGEAVASAVRGARWADRVVVSSFDHVGLLEVREHAPGLELAPLYADGLARPWDYAAMLGVKAMHPFAPTLQRPGTVESFRAAGIAVRPWTVIDPAEMRAFMQAEVDAVIVDDPATAIAVRDVVAAGAKGDASREGGGLAPALI
ncbi:glycerophosphodiester phosphodiesterase family protein [Demequina capsici]|uniref:Glycerophosphodiester phosphodiesterase family protein n=1 Tax=Demequina capsici TaxID=3075620 RepID=A0AA96F607_9MICO|nr:MULTISPECIES: glycerophosphodiester phosphodiesterase family protein [unclassified Demequina]WNM23410.1 glycerophosphodiester phosphodiesterase family protein [Demequina sp. OYTSA14]WNM26287.1 glycerophosphodiester phosphodiesterase family protein [Demequina sp. PMTSA13]